MLIKSIKRRTRRSKDSEFHDLEIIALHKLDPENKNGIITTLLIMPLGVCYTKMADRPLRPTGIVKKQWANSETPLEDLKDDESVESWIIRRSEDGFMTYKEFKKAHKIEWLKTIPELESIPPLPSPKPGRPRLTMLEKMNRRMNPDKPKFQKTLVKKRRKENDKS
jgi:hypothetical protein